MKMFVIEVGIGFLIGFFVCFIAYIGIRPKNKTMLIYYLDGTWFMGVRKWYFKNSETYGTHHYIIKDGSEPFKLLVGRKIAVPISQVKYFVLD